MAVREHGLVFLPQWGLAVGLPDACLHFMESGRDPGSQCPKLAVEKRECGVLRGFDLHRGGGGGYGVRQGRFNVTPDHAQSSTQARLVFDAVNSALLIAGLEGEILM